MSSALNLLGLYFGGCPATKSACPSVTCLINNLALSVYTLYSRYILKWLYSNITNVLPTVSSEKIPIAHFYGLEFTKIIATLIIFLFSVQVNLMSFANCSVTWFWFILYHFLLIKQKKNRNAYLCIFINRLILLGPKPCPPLNESLPLHWFRGEFDNKHEVWSPGERYSYITLQTFFIV